MRPQLPPVPSVIRSVGATSSHLPALNFKRLIPQDRRHEAYYDMIRMFSKEGNGNEANNWLGRMVNERLVPDIHAYNLVIGAYSKRGEVANALRAFDKISEDNLTRPNIVSYNTVISTLSRDHNTDSLSELSRWYGRLCRHRLEPDRITFSSLIHACSKHSNPTRAKHYLKKCLELKIEPNIYIYAGVINAHGRVGDALGAVEIFEQMISHRMRPDIITYQGVVHAFSKQNNPAAALIWLERMKKDGLKPDVITWSSIIGAMARSGDLTTAKRVLQEMKESGIQPDVKAFTIFINVCADNRDIAGCEGWFDELIESKVRPDTRVFTGVVTACARAGEPHKAWEWCRRMKEFNCRPDNYIYNAVVDAFSRVGDHEGAKMVLAEMEKAGVEARLTPSFHFLKSGAKTF